jgi:hypothetical protein
MIRRSLANLETVVKNATFALALLLGAPLVAQSYEVGLFVGQQKYAWAQIPAHGPSSSPIYTPDQKTIWGIRLGCSVVTLGPASLQLNAGFQPESKSRISATPPDSPWDFSESHWSVGAVFHFKALLDWGVGIEQRMEKLSGNQFGGSDSTTSNRAWGVLNASWTRPGPTVKPFIGVECAFPLSVSNHQGSYSSQADTLKAMAPSSQIGLYTGIRF